MIQRILLQKKKEGCFVSLPHNNEEIERAFDYIKMHVSEMSECARETFFKEYEYKIYLEKAKEVFEIK